MHYLIARLKEPSTWAGLAAVLVAFGLTIPPDLIGALIPVATALAGLAAVLLKEA